MKNTLLLGFVALFLFMQPVQASETVTGVVMTAGPDGVSATNFDPSANPNQYAPTYSLRFVGSSASQGCFRYALDQVTPNSEDKNAEYKNLNDKQVTLFGVRDGREKKGIGKTCLFSSYKINGEDPGRAHIESTLLQSMAYRFCQTEEMNRNWNCKCLADAIVATKKDEIEKNMTRYNKTQLELQDLTAPMIMIQKEGGSHCKL
jgi:hypothetical protein